MVLSCLPGLRDALARLVSALCAACREAAAEASVGGAEREALRGAAAGLEQSMGRELGFWRSDEYAVRSVLRLVAEEAELELLLTRLQQLLTATPRQSHVRPKEAEPNPNPNPNPTPTPSAGAFQGGGP